MLALSTREFLTKGELVTAVVKTAFRVEVERRWEGLVSQSTASGESRQARGRGPGTLSFQTLHAGPGLQHHLSVVSSVVLL